MNARFAASRSLSDLINEGLRRAYMNRDNPLRASIVLDPPFARNNTRDNTPAVVHLCPANTSTSLFARRAAGSENMARFVTLNPSDSVVDWVLDTVPTLGAGWCPPGIIGIGIGGSCEKSLLLAKEALLEPIDMSDLLLRGASTPEEEMRLTL